MFMKKNGFLTFVFACIPGAGQMYYGYMKRGVSIITWFALIMLCGEILSPLLIFNIVLYMFSFFDTYDIIRCLAAGDPKKDDFLMPEGWKNGEFWTAKAGWSKTSVGKGVGAALVLSGAYLLLDRVLSDLLYRLANYLGVDPFLWYSIVEQLPTIVVAVVLIWFGCRLLGIGGRKRNRTDDDLPPYQGEGK